MSKTSTDPIADMLSRIRNAIIVRHQQVNLPHSNIKEGIAKVLKQNNLIEDFKVGKDSFGNKLLTINIYSAGSVPPITEIVRISKPGRRLYSKAERMPKIKSGRGIVVVSTSHGLMTGDEAKAKGIGGELICEVY